MSLPDPRKLSFLTLGIGNAFARRYFNSSLLLFAGGRRVLLDCPGPIRRILLDAGNRSGITTDLPDVDDIILTHLHGDHANGMEEVGFYKKYYQDGARATVYMLPENVTELWEGRLRAAMGPRPGIGDGTKSLDGYYNIVPWEEGVEHHIGELTIRIRRTRHMLPCFGMVIEFAGRRLGFSGDTIFEQEHIDFLSECDLIVHEMGDSKGHTRYSELMDLPAEIRRKMRLIHIPDEFDPSTSAIPVLEEGILVEV